MVVSAPLGLRFPPMTPDPNAGLDEIRLSFRAWLCEHQGSLEPFRSDDPGNLADSYARFRPLMRMLFDAGWTRLGWPESCGGLGGSPVQRAEVMEELAATGYIIPELYATTEIIAPMLIKYAPELAALHVAKAIAGDEVWCQGFSEPDAGSDLGSLRTRAGRGRHFPCDRTEDVEQQRRHRQLELRARAHRRRREPSSWVDDALDRSEFARSHRSADGVRKRSRRGGRGFP